MPDALDRSTAQVVAVLLQHRSPPPNKANGRSLCRTARFFSKEMMERSERRKEEERRKVILTVIQVIRPENPDLNSTLEKIGILL